MVTMCPASGTITVHTEALRQGQELVIPHASVQREAVEEDDGRAGAVLLHVETGSVHMVLTRFCAMVRFSCSNGNHPSGGKWPNCIMYPRLSE